MTTIVIPGKNAEGESIAPLQGLRFYNLDIDYSLIGGYGGRWPTNYQRAECAGNPERARMHLLNGEHTCGFYIRTDGRNIEQWKPVIATCYAWGACDELDKGARVEHVQITGLAIHLPALRQAFSPSISVDAIERIKESLSKRYGVEVV